MSDFYFIGLSVWDSLGSYDQLGIVSSNYNNKAHWFPAYSYSDPCGTVHSNWDVNVEFAPGTRYTFTMGLTGTLLYYTFSYGGRVVDRIVHATTAAFFFIDDAINCNGQTPYDFQLYEEVKKIVGNQNAPAWSFFFSGTKVDGSPWTAWWEFYNGTVPAQVFVTIDSGLVNVNNEFFLLSMTPANKHIYTTDPPFVWSGQVTHLYQPSPGCLFQSCVVVILPVSIPNGWQVGIDPDNGVPTFAFSLYVTPPAHLAPGVYKIELLATNDPRGEVTYVTVTIIAQILGSGGCVAAGTYLATPTGNRTIDTLPPGSQVVGYSVVSGSTMTVTLLWANRSVAPVMFSINGALSVTPADQPLYMANETYEGWLQNPQQLDPGNVIYGPSMGRWFIVLDLSFTAQSTTIYDVVTSDPGTFIASGMLLLKK